MSALALSLVLLSVCLHAGWNLLGKGRAPSLAFFVLAMGCGALMLSPILWMGPSPAALPPAFWGWLVASGLCQMLYMGGLAWAYARGEISVLYPIARALPVVLVPLVSVGVLGSRALTSLDMLGMGLILIGALCLPLTSQQALSPSTYLTAAFGYALLAAVATAGYSLIDNQALLLMVQSGHSSFLAGGHFMVLQALATCAWGIPTVLLLRVERRHLPSLWRQERIAIPLTGIMVLSTYGLVLVAMALTEEVSLVVAMRQLSIPLGVLLGVWWLRERAAPAKWLGTALMLAGLWVVALP
ncbi:MULTISPECIES: EamA family transporter [Halomonadaceae]|uniref:EamA family transporter n=1 Tax=Halomonadaceae TaxID=28256 RepID=UPI0015841445|nr:MULTISPECIES: EamA family transporter [Halomonas]MDI4638498.1 EamA family transporter [Halomonas sp. BMC7]NUJ59484.1 EamA family transporter [Halomonas taeanensis]